MEDLQSTRHKYSDPHYHKLYAYHRGRMQLEFDFFQFELPKKIIQLKTNRRPVLNARNDKNFSKISFSQRGAQDTKSMSHKTLNLQVGAISRRSYILMRESFEVTKSLSPCTDRPVTYTFY